MNGATFATSWSETTSSDAGSVVAAVEHRAGSETPAFTYLDYSVDRGGVPRTLT